MQYSSVVPAFRAIRIATYLGLIVSAVLILTAPLVCADVTFSDGTFNTPDWNADITFNTASGTVEVTQILSGGNPGAYQFIEHDYSGPGDIDVAHVYNPSMYDPSQQGAIISVDFSWDTNVFNYGASHAVAFVPLIYQNGAYYVASLCGGYCADGVLNTWVHYDTGVLQLSSFALARGSSGPAHPDGSATGAPLQFGYMSSNGTAFASPTFTQSGIDNWNVTIHSTPALAMTTTAITCVPKTLVGLGLPTDCTATVTSSNSTIPMGSVNFSSSGAGTFLTSSCGLAQSSSNSSSCIVIYSPNEFGKQTITAIYSGDTNNATSSNSFLLIVSTLNVNIQLSPNPVLTGLNLGSGPLATFSNGTDCTSGCMNVVLTITDPSNMPVSGAEVHIGAPLLLGDSVVNPNNGGFFGGCPTPGCSPEEVISGNPIVVQSDANGIATLHYFTPGLKEPTPLNITALVDKDNVLEGQGSASAMLLPNPVYQQTLSLDQPGSDLIASLETLRETLQLSQKACDELSKYSVHELDGFCKKISKISIKGIIIPKDLIFRAIDLAEIRWFFSSDGFNGLSPSGLGNPVAEIDRLLHGSPPDSIVEALLKSIQDYYNACIQVDLRAPQVGDQLQVQLDEASILGQAPSLSGGLLNPGHSELYYIFNAFDFNTKQLTHDQDDDLITYDYRLWLPDECISGSTCTCPIGVSQAINICQP